MGNQTRTNRKKNSRKKLVLKIVSVVILTLVLGTGAYGYYIYNSVQNTVDEEMHEAIPTLKNKKGPVLQEGEPINVLVMGVDKRPGDKGRTDTLMVVSLNPNTNSMQMISIPRDSRTKIIGKGFMDKINHAYAFGGTDMTVATVQHFADIDLDYYIKMNMQGLSDLVDAIGGITVYNDDSWHDPGYYKKGYFYHEGTLHLNGPQTMGYVRMRYIPGGDFARNEHQREVIKAIIEKTASISAVTRLHDILNVLGDNVKTNMTFDEMKDIFFNYKECRKNISTYQVKGNGTKIDGTYYLKVSEKERNKIHNMIKEFNSQK